jgi:hypothetical protein
VKRKAPNKYTRFAYARIPCEAGVTYRLSRRDFRGVLHFAWKTFKPGYDKRMQAIVLRSMCHALREHVDAIELHLLGVKP